MATRKARSTRRTTEKKPDPTRNPDVPVQRILDEARDLVTVAMPRAAALVASSKLTAGFPQRLKAARSALEEAEAARAEARRRPSGRAELAAVRAAAQRLRGDTAAALRYFVADDEGLQRKLTAIAKLRRDYGLGHALLRLARLVEPHQAALTKARKLPRSPAAALQLAAANLSAAIKAESFTSGARRHAIEQTLVARNRAYWILREQMQAVRSAGTYVFGDDPAQQALFRTRTAASRKKKKPTKG